MAVLLMALACVWCRKDSKLQGIIDKIHPDLAREDQLKGVPVLVHTGANIRAVSELCCVAWGVRAEEQFYAENGGREVSTKKHRKPAAKRESALDAAKRVRGVHALLQVSHCGVVQPLGDWQGVTAAQCCDGRRPAAQVPAGARH